MAIKRVKKVKKAGGLGAGRSAGSSRNTSDLRPYHEEKNAPCMVGCPQGTYVREALNLVSLHEKQGNDLDTAFTKSWENWTDMNPFPAILGRVCPHPCEDVCTRSDKDGAVGINKFERFIGDWGIEKNLALRKDEDAQDYSEKVAVIGGGPSGLNCAYHLARKGYKVTVFEAFEKAGGQLRYGIPDYRLPQDILDTEIQRILDLGVELKTNTAVGRDINVADLHKEFEAVYVGIGAHVGKKLRLDLEDDLENVLTGAAFLNQVNSGNIPTIGDKVVVVGGGDSAMDAARVARRLGAEVTLVYRRTRDEMPAIEEDIVGGEHENVDFRFLCTPVELFKDGDRCTGMKCQKMELGEPDSSGRRRPVPVEEYFDLECTYLIPSISQEPDFMGLEDYQAGPREWVHIDKFGEKTESEKHDVYAGGDVTDLGLATIAMAQGRRAAETIHCRFRDLPIEEYIRPEEIKKEKVLMDYFDPKPRVEVEEADPNERIKDLATEISRTFTKEEAFTESSRCMSCGKCVLCGQCWTYCQDQVIQKPEKPGDLYGFKHELCQGCKKCEEVCPCGYIIMK